MKCFACFEKRVEETIVSILLSLEVFPQNILDSSSSYPIRHAGKELLHVRVGSSSFHLIHSCPSVFLRKQREGGYLEGIWQHFPLGKSLLFGGNKP